MPWLGSVVETHLGAPYAAHAAAPPRVYPSFVYTLSRLPVWYCHIYVVPTYFSLALASQWRATSIFIVNGKCDTRCCLQFCGCPWKDFFMDLCLIRTLGGASRKLLCSHLRTHNSLIHTIAALTNALLLSNFKAIFLKLIRGDCCACCSVCDVHSNGSRLISNCCKNCWSAAAAVIDNWHTHASTGCLYLYMWFYQTIQYSTIYAIIFLKKWNSLIIIYLKLHFQVKWIIVTGIEREREREILK